mmetsp:Transcript_92692/g.264792  ORF Transcript_92692/g.264792 Transcript_92692/m.264792 type:complete len:180 (-) Transcript_92692:289-828(-)
MRAFLLSLVALVSTAAAFTPARHIPVRSAALNYAARPKAFDILDAIQDNQLLSKTAELGVLSKAEAAGVTLSDLEPLLIAADDNGAMQLLGDVLALPITPKLINAAPGLLPLAGAALSVPPALLFATAPASAFAAYTAVQVIPDDSLTSVALQTFLAVLLGAVIPAVSLAGGAVLGYKK